jgi:periplasmic divalent cation tolerance protein
MGAVSTDIVQVAVTFDDETAADALVRDAVEARLAACGQVDGPITSVFRWEGAIETAVEWRATFKTTTARAGELEAFVVERHPYDVPEVLRTPVVGGRAAYLEWVRAEVTPTAR